MDKILVFGATGAVGSFVLRQLPGRFHVIGVSRHSQPGPGHWICADLNDRDAAWPDVDIVISAGPLDGFAQWLQRYSGRTLRRVIALSSMSAQTKRDSDDVHERELSRRLRSCESEVLTACASGDIACTLFRPTLIYGAGTDRSLARIARFAWRWRILPIPVGATGLRQPIHAQDIASACLAVMDSPTTFAKTYSLGGAERLRFDSLLERLRHSLPIFVLPIPIPITLLHLVGKLGTVASITPAMILRLREPLIADNDPAVRDFGFCPRDFHAEQVLPAGR